MRQFAPQAAPRKVEHRMPNWDHEAVPFPHRTIEVSDSVPSILSTIATAAASASSTTTAAVAATHAAAIAAAATAPTAAAVRSRGGTAGT